MNVSILGGPTMSHDVTGRYGYLINTTGATIDLITNSIANSFKLLSKPCPLMATLACLLNVLPTPFANIAEILRSRQFGESAESPLGRHLQ